MGKILKFSFILSLIIGFSIFFPGCGKKEEISSDSEKKAIIGSVNYDSLTEAVENAQSGDTIKIYNDIKDNKNVVIDKPLSIEGIENSSQIKPKFYGSFTINLSGQDDSILIKNIEIIHSGICSDGKNNDNRIGINLIDGGLVLKSSIIALKDEKNKDDNASGLVISRKINSENVMPIIIEGNSFETYNVGGEGLSSALIIKSNKEGEFKKLSLNENEILNKNTFSTKGLGNQMISVDYDLDNENYTYFSTTSLNELISALNENQTENGSVFNLINVVQEEVEIENPVTIKESNYVYISGNPNIDYNNLEILLEGFLEIKNDIKNLIIEKNSDIASVVFGQDVNMDNITVK